MAVASATSLAATSLAAAAEMERDGYVVVKSFLDKEPVAQARRDLEAIYAKDIEERRLRNADEPLFTHGSTKSYLLSPSHLVMGCPARARRSTSATRRSCPSRRRAT